jgi:glycosyltransferase involved in cell wall biosynthesis
VLGRYGQDELAGIVADLKPHLALLPFRIPETHSYALSDVMRLGLPLLATAIGAIPERVHGRPATWLVDVAPTNAEDFIGWIERLHADRLSTPPRWTPIDHLPPLTVDFYASAYLAPLAHDAGAELPARQVPA